MQLGADYCIVSHTSWRVAGGWGVRSCPSVAFVLRLSAAISKPLWIRKPTEEGLVREGSPICLPATGSAGHGGAHWSTQNTEDGTRDRFSPQPRGAAAAGRRRAPGAAAGSRRRREALGSAGAPRAARLLVLVQQGHAGEGPRAGLALVLLDLRVCLQVGAQVGAVGEGAAAE